MKKYTNKILISIGIIYLLIVFFGVWFVVAAAKEAGDIDFNHSPYTYSDEEEIYPEDSTYFYDIEDTMPANME